MSNSVGSLHGIQRLKNLLQENGYPEPVFNVDKITAFEVIVKPTLSLNLVTDEEKVTKLSDILNEIMLFCSTPRSMAERDRVSQCPTHFSQATGEMRLFRRTLTCPCAMRCTSIYKGLATFHIRCSRNCQ